MLTNRMIQRTTDRLTPHRTSHIPTLKAFRKMMAEVTMILLLGADDHVTATLLYELAERHGGLDPIRLYALLAEAAHVFEDVARRTPDATTPTSKRS
jgi:hypothetical protein